MPHKNNSGKFKLKTHKGTSKRFRATGSGMLVRTKGGKAHLRRKSSKRVKALFAEMVPVAGRSYIKRLRRLLPNL